MQADPSKPNAGSDPQRRADARSATSRCAAWLGVLLLACSAFLISPDPNATYPGAIPWSDFSILRVITDAMSLGHAAATARGVEIKDLAFYLAVGLGLLLLAVQAVVSFRRPSGGRQERGPWFLAQGLLGAWVLMSLLSQFWSGDAALSRDQAVIYGLQLGWAVALGWTMDRKRLATLLYGFLTVAAVGAVITIWYFHERNPNHRPGFPIGNPGPLAAFYAAGVVVAIGLIVRGVQAALSGTQVEPGARRTLGIAGAAGAIALVPLIWGFRLASARSAQIGLAVGLAVLIVLAACYVLRLTRNGRRAVVVGVVAVFALGAWWYVTTRDDYGETREGTLRFRLYMWRYVAEFWGQRPISGMGAASFARLCGRYSMRDRALDPAAFFGEWDGHAHNELFEILAEIGLLGGLTYVGGFVATGIAVVQMLRRVSRPGEKWLIAALASALAVLLSDSMFNVSLRLPGIPAAFFTLLGTLWAACRTADEEQPRDLTAIIESVMHPARRARRMALAAASVAGAAAAFYFATVNWMGVLDEKAAEAALGRGSPADAARYSDAGRYSERAEVRLLDPLRKLYSGVQRVRAEFARAQTEFDVARRKKSEAGASSAAEPVATQPTASASRAARISMDDLNPLVRRCESVYAAAEAMHVRAPTLAGMPAIMAQCAEMLYQLAADSDAAKAREWIQAAHAAWSLQHEQDRYDPTSALALTYYQLPLDRHIAVMCEALRSGPPSDAWRERLAVIAARPGFDEMLARFIVQAGPMDPQTDLDSLVISMAPEVYRFAAAYSAMRRAYDDAARYADRAAALYKPMKSRFPLLWSVALTEKADYSFRAHPEAPLAAIDAAGSAIDGLPDIQRQQRDAVAFPIRRKLVFFLLAEAEAARTAGRDSDVAALNRRAEQTLVAILGKDAAVDVAVADSFVMLVEWFIPDPPATRPALEPWLRAALRRQPAHARAWSWLAYLPAEGGDAESARRILANAGAAGVPAPAIAAMKQGLKQRFPALRIDPDAE